METISVLLNQNASLPKVSAVHVLPVYALKNFSFSFADPIDPSSLPKREPYGLFINRLFHEEDLEPLDQLLKSDAAKHAETIYFADPAVLFLSDESVKKKLIYRPETLVTCSEDARFYKDTGILGVSISPVLTKEETFAILEEVEGCEVTIHGHSLLSLSARRLLSAYRDTGAYFDIESRTLFLQEEKRKERMHVRETPYGTLIASGSELECFDLIQQFHIRNAMRYFIEASLMSQEDLEAVTGIYAQLLEGSDCFSAVKDYRAHHPLCTEGFYAEETIL